MKTVILSRTLRNNYVTQGYITIDGRPISYTIERPWVNNKVGESCIPCGMYTLRHCATSKTMPKEYKGETYEVENVQGRSLIKLHVANKPLELEGCIAPNMGVDWEAWSGQKSANAMLAFMDAMRDKNGELVEAAMLIVREV